MVLSLANVILHIVRIWKELCIPRANMSFLSFASWLTYYRGVEVIVFVTSNRNSCNHFTMLEMARTEPIIVKLFLWISVQREAAL